MYDFLTWLHDEFEPLRAQLLARHPCVSLTDALAEVHNEKTRLQDARLLRVSSVMAGHSSVACHATPVPPDPPPVALSVAHGVSTSLHCDHYGHVEAFCYKKKKAHKAQAHRSSQSTSGSGSGGSERSSTGSKTH
jgi:hypothetical protein